ncbi:MAG TPA: hypothetical protein PK668_11360 [Myxococcota bacterium]|nr:hypothetical protein [Myxococcota bacterium]HRY93236.1 hypothetical protein [Myxococcota bacterium]HSA21035.1 hypothetical protein [Myxococcota bacterium]
MRPAPTVALLLLCLPACKGPEHTATRVLAQAGGQDVVLAARSLDDTSIRWAARAVGLEHEKGMALSLTIGDRPSIALERLSDAERAPSQAEVDAAVGRASAQVSPDGQHLLLSWRLAREERRLLHLLARGAPFSLDLPGAQLPAQGEPDWSKVPSSEQLALRALAVAAEQPDRCAIPGARGFWEALEDAAPGTPLEAPLLALWPACSHTWTLVPNITRNHAEVSATWRTALDAKVAGLLAPQASPKTLKAVLDLCLFIEDGACVQAAAPRLLPSWPVDDLAHDVVMEFFDRLPEEFRKQLVDRAMGPQAGYTAEQQARVYRLMKRWADCATFRRFVTVHLNSPQAREDCPGWPLERFPAEGDAPARLRALLGAGQRNEAIQLVRQSTGWEYMQAVKFVDAQAGAR